ncbi:MAG: hypothetical protein JW843_11590 [Candidatus Aminicenantes bacterium]|nr:hypothetical protein [Candidatus Aminicenantes bacterium]
MSGKWRVGKPAALFGCLLAGFIGCDGPGSGTTPAAGSVSSQAVAEETGLARLVFVLAPDREEIPFRQVTSAVLIRLERKERTQGAVKRWPGDTSDRYIYTDLEEVSFRPCDCECGNLILPPGFYRIVHNSVKGSPPAGMYGKSGIFEIAGSRQTEVRIMLHPAI